MFLKFVFVLIIIGIDTVFSLSDVSRSGSRISPDNSCLNNIKPNQGETFFSGQLNNTLLCLKTKLKEGLQEGSFPILDPLYINEKFAVKIDLPALLYTNMELSNFAMHGITDFDTISLTWKSALTLKADLRFNKIHMHASYDGNWNLLGLYGFYGIGTVDLEFTGVNIATSTVFRPDQPLINSFSLSANLDNFKLAMTEILGDDELSKALSYYMSKYILLFLNKYEKEISKAISPQLGPLLNSHTGNFTYLDFLAMLVNPSCDNVK